jgi:hypothetical protein
MNFIAKISFTVWCVVWMTTTSMSQKFNVSIEINNYENDTLIVGNYFGEKQLVKDTLFSKGKGKFLWTDTIQPPQGVYLLLFKPSNNFIQFMVPQTESKFALTCNYKDLTDVKFKGSKDNNLFYDYMDFLKDKRVLADTLRSKIERAKKQNTTDKASQDALDNLDNDVKKQQQEIISKNPNTLTALLLKGNTEIDVPEFADLPADSSKIRRYYYYKQHYFDNIDMNHPALIRTPFIHQKIDYYINKVSNQQPDSLMKTIDIVLSKLENNPEAYRYYLADLLNKFAAMKIVGHDALYIHMVDNYYRKGKASWISEENLKKMGDEADKMKPTLIGNLIPDITTYHKDGSAVRLYDLKSKFTILFLWDPTCGNCTKSVPFVVDFKEKHKHEDIAVLTICNKGGEKTNTCWPYIEEKNMSKLINTADEYQRYNQKLRVEKFPKIYILDQDKRILIKDFPAEKLDEIFIEISKY